MGTIRPLLLPAVGLGLGAHLLARGTLLLRFLFTRRRFVGSAHSRKIIARFELERLDHGRGLRLKSLVLDHSEETTILAIQGNSSALADLSTGPKKRSLWLAVQAYYHPDRSRPFLIRAKDTLILTEDQ
jgi:hypothetical protein